MAMNFQPARRSLSSLSFPQKEDVYAVPRYRSSHGLSSQHPVGRDHPHVMESYGADSNKMKFYHTRSSADFGSNFAQFQPKQFWRHSGTGYAANLRPQIYYSQRLDELDNPFMGRVCRQNYNSETGLKFRDHLLPNGREVLPYDLHVQNSGFTRQKGLSIANDYDARSVHYDTRNRDEIYPKHRPYLHQIGPHAKDPVGDENKSLGPKYMSTESKTKYAGDTSFGDYSRHTIGRIEDTGNTRNRPIIDPLQNIAMSAHRHDLPPYITNRPTERSLTQKDFVPYGRPIDEGDKVGKISDKITRDNFDTRPMWTSGKRQEPLAKDTTYNLTHDGRMHSDQTEPDLLSRVSISEKQLGGQSKNRKGYIPTLGDKTRFVTNYKTFFQDTTSTQRRPPPTTGVEDPWNDAFTRSQGLNSFGETVNSTDTLRMMKPYQARSIHARDKFYDDHTYDRKLLQNQPNKQTIAVA